MKITIAYWHLKKYTDLPYEHNQIMETNSKSVRNKIIDTILDAGYSIMLRKREEELIIWIDKHRFGQN